MGKNSIISCSQCSTECGEGCLCEKCATEETESKDSLHRALSALVSRIEKGSNYSEELQQAKSVLAAGGLPKEPDNV